MEIKACLIEKTSPGKCRRVEKRFSPETGEPPVDHVIKQDNTFLHKKTINYMEFISPPHMVRGLPT